MVFFKTLSSNFYKSLIKILPVFCLILLLRCFYKCKPAAFPAFSRCFLFQIAFKIFVASMQKLGFIQQLIPFFRRDVKDVVAAYEDCSQLYLLALAYLLGRFKPHVEVKIHRLQDAGNL